MGTIETLAAKLAEDTLAVMDATGGKGANVIVETAGPGNLEKSFASAAFGGRISLVGGFEQAKAPINTIPMIGKGLTLRGVAVGSRKMMEDLLATLVKSNQKPVIDKTIDFKDAPSAYTLMKSGQHVGKIVIKH